MKRKKRLDEGRDMDPSREHGDRFAERGHSCPQLTNDNTGRLVALILKARCCGQECPHSAPNARELCVNDI